MIPRHFCQIQTSQRANPQQSQVPMVATQFGIGTVCPFRIAHWVLVGCHYHILSLNDTIEIYIYIHVRIDIYIYINI